MKTYRALFNGRLVGAIGRTEYFDVTAQGENEDDARIRLYDKYDHILGLTLVEGESKINGSY